SLTRSSHHVISLFFFHATAPTAIYTLSLHDALPISVSIAIGAIGRFLCGLVKLAFREEKALRPLEIFFAPSPALGAAFYACHGRSEEHTSELQSRGHLVCRLLLEKKKKKSAIV